VLLSNLKAFEFKIFFHFKILKLVFKQGFLPNGLYAFLEKLYQLKLLAKFNL